MKSEREKSHNQKSASNINSFFFCSIWTDVSLGMARKIKCIYWPSLQFWSIHVFSSNLLILLCIRFDCTMRPRKYSGHTFGVFFRQLLRCFTVVKLFALVAKRREENCNGRRFSWRKGLKITVFRTNNEGFATTHGSDALSFKTVVHLKMSIASKQEVAEQLAKVLNRDRKVFLCSCSYEFRWTNFVHTKSNSRQTWRIMNKFYMLLTAKCQFGFESQSKHICTGICRKTVFGGVSWLKLMISVLLINYRFFWAGSRKVLQTRAHFKASKTRLLIRISSNRLQCCKAKLFAQKRR